jgi:hypothetical protein
MPFLLFSQSISVRQWVYAGLLWCCFALSISALWNLVPPSSPVVLVGEPRGEMMPSGRWRITRTINRTAVCGSEIWTRIFRTTDGDRRIAAVASSSGRSLEPTTAGGAAVLGVHEAWWEYEPIPGIFGTYNVVLSAGWCRNGYSDVEAVYVVPFDWR